MAQLWFLVGGFSPTPLKDRHKSSWIISPQKIGVNIKTTHWNQHLAMLLKMLIAHKKRKQHAKIQLECHLTTVTSTPSLRKNGAWFKAERTRTNGIRGTTWGLVASPGKPRYLAGLSPHVLCREIHKRSKNSGDIVFQAAFVSLNQNSTRWFSRRDLFIP